MKTILFVVGLLVLVACGHRHVNVYQNINGSSCSTSQTPEGAKVECTDGTSAVITNGLDGLNGSDGVDGTNGTNSIVNIIDPCGDGNGPDEILLVLDNGQVVAWYSNLGLTVLQPNELYQTTDTQRCKFRVDMNGNVTLH